MKIEEFIEKFKKVTSEKNGNIQAFMKKIIKADYVTYADKINKSTRIINYAFYGQDGNFRINTPVKYLLYILTLISTYTVIEIDYEHGMECYDALNAVGAIDVLRAAMPTAEVQEFDIILSMMEGDLLENERSLVSYVENKMKVLTEMLNGIDLEKISKALEEVKK